MKNRGRNLLGVMAGWLLLGSFILEAQVPARTSVEPFRYSPPPAKIGSRTTAPGQIGGPSQSLDELIIIALAHNPSIKSAAERYKAEQAKAPQARALPDPMVSGGWMGNITPFSIQHGDPSSYRGLTVTQSFPIPAKLRLRGQIADRGAEAAWWAFEQTQRQVTADVKVSYYDYFYYSKALEVTAKDKDLLEKLANIAESLYRVGKGMQADVFRAQLEVSKVDQRLIVLLQQQDTTRARLNTLIFRDPESPLSPPQSIRPAELNTSLVELYALAHQGDPELEGDRRTIEGNRFAVNLARKAYVPDFNVSYNYEQRPGMPDMNGAMLGINIPIFYRTKQRQGVIEATHDLIGAQRGLDARMTNLNFEIKQEYLTATASLELSKLYAKAIVPQSSLELESSIAAYEVGKLDFLSMLTSFIDVLDYQIGYYEQVSKYQGALARLEPLVGKELTR